MEGLGAVWLHASQQEPEVECRQTPIMKLFGETIKSANGSQSLKHVAHPLRGTEVEQKMMHGVQQHTKAMSLLHQYDG